VRRSMCFSKTTIMHDWVIGFFSIATNLGLHFNMRSTPVKHLLIGLGESPGTCVPGGLRAGQ
jgi:hypothetical protein